MGQAAREAGERTRSWLALALVASVLAMGPGLTSCITAALWGGELREEQVVESDGHTVAHFEVRDDDESSSGAELRSSAGLPGWAHRLLLTPVTLLLDVVTFPVQAFLLGWDVGAEVDV